MKLEIESAAGNMDDPEEKPTIADSDDIMIHMDMKVYNEEESNNCDGESDSLPRTHDEYLGIQCNGKDVFSNILKDHSEENVANGLSSEIKIEPVEAEKERNTFNVDFQTSVTSIKTVLSNGDNECDNNENSNFKTNIKKWYGLRKRKKFSVKDSYNSSDSDMLSMKKVPPSQKPLLECSRCSCRFTSLNNCVTSPVLCSFCISVKYEKCSNDKVAFKCEKCNRIFNNENELELHIIEKQCRDMKGYTCDVCKSTFTDFNVLKRHIAAHLENPLQCLKCSESFDSELLLTKHNCKTMQHACRTDDESPKEQSDVKLFEHQDGNYKCLKCNKLFSSQNFLEEHGLNCSLIVQKCPHCEKEFRDRVQYEEHAKFHKENIRNCKNCKKKFKDEVELDEHLRDCHALNKRVEYECNVCHKKYLRLSKLQMHTLNSHHGVLYECEKCNMKFASEEQRDLHLAKDCQTEELCSCKICGKLFVKKDYLKKHEYVHSNILHRCKFCHCAFMKEKSYKKHIEGMNCSKSARKIRLSEFNYKKCRICETEFEEEDHLIKHFDENHHGENPHQCFCCDSRLPTYKDLQNHIHLHNVQKYTCNLCGKPYTSQQGFRRHRLKHKGPEFKCQFCESEFLNERRFKCHMKTCKKNPDSAYHNSENKTRKKDDRPKQSRQLHWESAIIMKRLRGDPNSVSDKCPSQTRSQESVTSVNIFDEPDPEPNVRGWFDDYYKTEEDDVAFGLKKDSKCNNSAMDSQKVKNQVPATNKAEGVTSGAENENEEGSNESSASETSDSSSEEEFIEEVELPNNYNRKKCRICMITFSQEYELLHHFIKVHPDKKAHKCPNCDVEYPLFAQLKEHMKDHGIGIGIYNCDNCSKRFRSEKKMKSHNIRCKGLDIEAALSDGVNKKNTPAVIENEDYCKRCGKKFLTKCGYRRHKQLCKEKRKANKENKKAETYEEPVPAAVVDTNLDCPSPADKSSEEGPAPVKPETAETETNPTDAPDPQGDTSGKDMYVGAPPLDSFPCRLCDEKFQYERGIVMHFKIDHPGHKPLVCHICNMHLADKLKEHLKTHGIGEEFICELCGKRFNQKFLSKIHEMWHQGIEYKCGKCKQKFLNKEKMDKHISVNRCRNRQSLMRLPCDICGKSYRSKFGLNKHYITHTPKELRPVKNRMNCEFCGKWFETNNGLQRHRRIHTGERPFRCRFCSKAFVQEGNCKSHERIHTGEPKPRRKRSGPSEPVTYSTDITSLIFNNANPVENMQTGLQ